MSSPTTTDRPPATPLTRKGQLTMPVEIRRFLGVDTADRIEWLKQEDGSVKVRPARSVTASLRGRFMPRPGSENLTMDQIIAESLADQDDDIMRGMGDE